MMSRCSLDLKKKNIQVIMSKSKILDFSLVVLRKSAKQGICKINNVK